MWREKLECKGAETADEKHALHRLALSTDKQGVLEIAEKGKEIQKAEDILKDPYVFEFLGIPQ